MKQTAVVNLMKITPASIIASNRIAKFLSSFFELPLIDRPESCSKFYKTLIVVNGPMLYCGFRDELQKLCEHAERIIWVQNDYAIAAPTFIKNKNPIFWSSCERAKEPFDFVYTNWNQLTFVPEFQSTSAKKKIPGLCYYGAYRKDRETYFRKYFEKTSYPLFLSSSKNGTESFKEIAPKAFFFNAPNIIKHLNSVTASLYIEDETSHSRYCSPANRFYEALSAGCLQFFDRSVVGTFETAGIDISSWVVNSQDEVQAGLARSEDLRSKQLEAFARFDFKANLEREASEVFNKLGL